MRALVAPCHGLFGAVEAPPSKNYTARSMLAAALAEGESLIVNPAVNDDALTMRRCLIELGAEIEPIGRDLRLRGFGARPRARASLDVGNAGAVLRFLLAIAALGTEIRFHTSFPDSLGRRPHDDLLCALRVLGAEVESSGGRLPIVVRGRRPAGGSVDVGGAVSSQFTSALLFLAPLLPAGLQVKVTGGLRSRAAVATTLEVLALAGIRATADWERLVFNIEPGQAYRAGRFVVNGDYPAAMAILAPAAMIAQGDVTVTGLYEDSQGERTALDCLAAMGAGVERGTDWVRVSGDGRLGAVTFNGDQAIDAVLSLATAAAFAAGASIFTRVGHLRHKESNRLEDFATEMQRAGLAVEARMETLLVKGQPGGIEGGTIVRAHQDHRLVMALTAAGLRSRQGLTIEGAEHVSKSYPGFFADLGRLGAKIQLEE